MHCSEKNERACGERRTYEWLLSEKHHTTERAVERWTYLCNKGMRLAKKIARLEIDKLALISRAILLFLPSITLDLIILIDISNRFCGARTFRFRENAAWSQCQCFEKVLKRRGSSYAPCICKAAHQAS